MCSAPGSTEWGGVGRGCRCLISLPAPPRCHPAQLVQRGHPLGTEWQGEHSLIKELLNQGMAPGCAHRDGDSRDSPFPWSPTSCLEDFDKLKALSFLSPLDSNY